MEICSLDFIFLIESNSFKFLLGIQFLGYLFTPEEAGDIDLLALHLASHLRLMAIIQTLNVPAELLSKCAMSPLVCSPKTN